MKKFISLIACVIFTTTIMSGNVVGAKNTTLQDIASNLPAEQKILLEHAIQASKNGETQEFLTSDEGIKLTAYLKEHPETASEIIENTEAYKAFKKQKKNSINQKFNDGSFVTEEENIIVENASAKTSTLAKDDYGTTINSNTNRVSYGWIIASAYVTMTTKYKLHSNGKSVKITDVTGNGQAFGVGAVATYNGDATENNNESASANSTSSYTVGMSVPYDSTGTVYLKTKFDKQQPRRANSGALPDGYEN